MLGIGDIVTFKRKEKIYMSQKVSVITEVKEQNFVFTEGNAKPVHKDDIVLVCSSKDRKDIN